MWEPSNLQDTYLKTTPHPFFETRHYHTFMTTQPAIESPHRVSEVYLFLPPHRVFLGFGSHPLALGLCCSVSFAGASCNFACGDVPGPGVGRSISSLALARQEKRIRNNRQPRLLPTWSVRGASNTNHSSPPSVVCRLISTSPPSSPHQSRATTTTFPR